ncbi:MAG: lasso peptide biosynthesis B2 protein, partial [Actinomycetes bacterium]
TYVDLHWSANGPGSVTPTFADVWERRTTASIGGQQLATLGIDDAAAHSCAHAYVDQWRWLRALVDIARLSALTDRGSSPQLAPSLAVSLSADVVRACFGPSSCDWPTSPPILRQRAVASSWHRQRQLDVDRAVSNRWRRSLYWAWHQDRLTAATGLADFTRTIAATALPPSSLVQAGTLVPAAAPSAVAGRALALAATRGAASPSEQTDSQVVRSNSRMSTRTRWLSRSRTGEALLLVSTARVLRATLPMASWQKLVGRKSAADSATPAVAVSPQGLERTVSLAVRRADERAPFHTTCLDQALAARWMLRRRGEHPVLVIGLNRADLSADPHAWLTGEHGGTVTGAAAMPDFVPVTEFR